MNRPLVQCTKCPLQFFYMKTTAGKSMPIDPEPNPEGNVEFIDGFAVAHGPMLAQLARDEGKVLWQSHFPTCEKWQRDHAGDRRPSNLREARAAAREGIAQVKGERSSSQEEEARRRWRVWAHDWTVIYLREHLPFFAEAMWDAGMREAGAHLWQSNWDERVYGPVVQQLAREGLIRKVGDAPRVHGRGSPGNRWESTIYVGEV